MLPDPPPARTLAPAGPAQPPQDPGRRRRLAFIGSQNLIDAGYNRRPGDGRLDRADGADARPGGATLNAVFATDWFVETARATRPPVRQRGGPATGPGDGGDICQVVPSGPGFPNENNLRLFNTLIYGARRRVTVTSPYFVPDESLLYAITTAAQRGVQWSCSSARWATSSWSARAEVVLPGPAPGGRADLPVSGPDILHAKFFSVDDDAAVLGSSNMDMRSFSLNFEVR